MKMGKESNRQYKLNIIILLTFMCLSFLSSVILAHFHYLLGAGDMQFHLKRIAELESTFRHFNLLPSFSFNQFHGAAIFLFYPYLNLYPIILLSLFIKSNITLIYVFFSLNIFLSLVISYYSSLNLSKSIDTSVVFSIVYSFSIPFLAYGFYDMDLGALTSLSVLPLAIFGFINLVKDGKWVGLASGMTLLIFSHVLDTIIVAFILLILLIINSKKIIKKKFCFDLFKAVVLVTLLTAIVWLPALVLWINNIGNLHTPEPLLLSNIGLKVLFRQGFLGYITYNLSVFALIALIIPLVFYRWLYKKFNKYTKQMYWISLAIILMCRFCMGITNHSPFKLIRIFQFTWRFYIIPELLLCYVFSVCITKCINSKRIKCCLGVISIILVILFQLFGQMRLLNESIDSPSFTRKYVNSKTFTRYSIKHMTFIYKKNPSFPYYKITNERQLKRLTNTYTDENRHDYYPTKALSKANYINNNKATYGHNRTINVKHTGYNQFSFDSPKRINRLALPIVCYNKEHIKLRLNHHTLLHQYHAGRVVLKDVCPGRHKIKIQNIFIYYWLFILRYVLFFILDIGFLIILIIKFIKKEKSNTKSFIRSAFHEVIIGIQNRCNTFLHNKDSWYKCRVLIPGRILGVITCLLIMYCSYVIYTLNCIPHKHERIIFIIFKNATLYFGLSYIILLFTLLLGIFMFWKYISLRTNKKNHCNLRVDINKCKIDIFKYVFDYILTIFNVVLAVISILLALKSDPSGDIILVDFSILILPCISALKFVQLWYSFKLPKKGTGYYNWEYIYKNL